MAAAQQHELKRPDEVAAKVLRRAQVSKVSLRVDVYRSLKMVLTPAANR